MEENQQLMNNSFALVSIIVTCYNHEKYIGECLKSLSAQTYPNKEILITDDCSQDMSAEIIQSWIERLEQTFVKVTYIRNTKNIGAVHSLNRMLQICQGDYIKLVDGDDMLLPNALADLTDFLEEHKMYGLVYSNHIFCEANERYNVEEFLKKKIEKPAAVFTNMSQALYENDFIIAPTVLIRKKVYDLVGLHDDNLCIADWEFWLRASFEFSIGYLDKVTAVYRIVSNSMSRFTMDVAGRKRLKTMVENELYILDKFKAYPFIKKEAGIRNCCDQGISVAIDLDAAEVVGLIRWYLEKNRVSLSTKMETKYILYKLHVWKWIKRFILMGRRHYAF